MKHTPFPIISTQARVRRSIPEECLQNFQEKLSVATTRMLVTKLTQLVTIVP